MVTVDKQVLKQILIDELDYTAITADLYLKDYPVEIHDELAQAYTQWLSDRTVNSEPIEELLIEEVMKK